MKESYLFNRPIQPIILCGGKGTRLWPLSRECFPKQYLTLIKENKYSMLQETFKRIEDIDDILDPIIICNEEHRFIAAEQFRMIGVKPKAIILEPYSKNTAPAIAISALKAIEISNDPILLILSSDHVIEDKNKFKEVIKNGLNYALKEKLVVFGVIPNSPETGYGYIKSKNALNKFNKSASEIEKFIEKPNQKKANDYIKDNRFSWNSGIFLFKASVIVKEIKKYNPEIINFCQEALDKNEKDLDFQRINADSFRKCPNISIDYAVMEKTNLGVVLPLNSGWSDVGSWDSLWSIESKNNEGNVILGKVISEKSKNCYLRSENKLLVGLGLENIVAVETNDAVLIANKNSSQEIKEVVQKINEKGFTEGKNHKKIFRPWGYYISIEESYKWQIKQLFVKPGESLSLQLHNHRSEHWIVVSGTADVEINNNKFSLNENQSTYIPVGSKHRLSNSKNEPLIIIEVQSGSYFGEDDIIRFDDKYGRNK